MKIFITAIGTDCGKTIISSIVCQALHASYWKPIQTGQESDTEKVVSLVSFPISVHAEQYRFPAPLSPHEAAIKENKEINLDTLTLPSTPEPFVVEGAGGILVPLNEKGEFLIDFIAKHDFEVILVIRLYLGCINHTLLSISEMNARKIKIKGLIFNGSDTYGAERIIVKLTNLPVLLRMKEEPKITKEIIHHYASQLNI